MRTTLLPEGEHGIRMSERPGFARQLPRCPTEGFGKDTPFPSEGACKEARPSSRANRIGISRNLILTPELGQYLGEKARAKVKEAVDECTRGDCFIVHMQIFSRLAS